MWDLPINIREQLVNEKYLYLKTSEKVQPQIEKLFFLAEQFFSLPLEEKEKFAAGNILTGFRRQGIESSVNPYTLESSFDLNETFYYKPADTTLFCNENSIFNAFFEQVGQLYKEYNELTCLLLDSIGNAYIKDYQKIETNLHTWLQINYYQPYMHEREFLQVEHDDAHLLTILAANDKGLEIQSKDGSYQQANYGYDQLLVYTGELMSLLTAFDIKALYHRVRNCADVKQRISIMYFVNPNLGQKIEPWVKNSTNEKVDIVEIAETLPLRWGLPKL